jgi:hypothetical protein
MGDDVHFLNVNPWSVRTQTAVNKIIIDVLTNTGASQKNNNEKDKRDR